jgi:hypothetical protein
MPLFPLFQKTVRKVFFGHFDYTDGDVLSRLSQPENTSPESTHHQSFDRISVSRLSYPVATSDEPALGHQANPSPESINDGIHLGDRLFQPPSPFVSNGPDVPMYQAVTTF